MGLGAQQGQQAASPPAPRDGVMLGAPALHVLSTDLESASSAFDRLSKAGECVSQEGCVVQLL